MDRLNTISEMISLAITIRNLSEDNVEKATLVEKLASLGENISITNSEISEYNLVIA